jgi:hypothetical protein
MFLPRATKSFSHEANITFAFLEYEKSAILYPYIEEKTTQWPNEKVQRYKQRSTKHTYKTKDRETRTPLKTGGELWCSGYCPFGIFKLFL